MFKNIRNKVCSVASTNNNNFKLVWPEAWLAPGFLCLLKIERIEQWYLAISKFHFLLKIWIFSSYTGWGEEGCFNISLLHEISSFKGCSRMALFDNESYWNFVYSLLSTRKKHISWKKYLDNRPSKKSHFIRVWPSNLHFYGYFKNGKMNFFQNSSLGRTPSALLIWRKKYCIIDLKIELSAISINISNYLPNLWFFFGPVNNKWFHSNLHV